MLRQSGQFLVLVLCFSGVVWAAGTPAVRPIPAGGKSMLAGDGHIGFQASFTAQAEGASKAVEVVGMPFKQALRLMTVKRPKRPWNIELRAGVRGDIREGDVCLLSFWVRGQPLAANDLLGHAGVQAFVQRNTAPHEKIARSLVAVGESWQCVYAPFVADRTLPDGAAAVTFHLGYDPQTVDIGGVELLNYGGAVDVGALPKSEFSYIGRRLTAPWRAAAARRIERVRKGDLSVRVVDRDGQPVKNAAVHVRMKRHAFGFGSAVRVDSLCADTEDGRKYRQFVLRHFNKVTIENALKPKWWPVAQTNAHEMFRRERTDRALAWLNEHGIEVRGHCTTWAPLNEKEAIRYTGKPEELRRDLTAHMREKLPAVGERVGEWDVVNHIVTRGVTLGTVLGGDEAYADIIRRSRGLAPGTELWVNEGSILHRGGRRDDYAEMLRFLVGRSAAPDGIGFMAHFRSEPFLTPPERLFDVCERFATIIPNLQLTELDIWTGKDEELQADYLRDVMIVAFSHPAVQGVVMWGFWAGNHWKPDLVLYRRDWSKKPAAVAWEDLVFRRWWTEESGKTGPDGFLKTRGFLGDYEIAVERAGTVKKTTSVLEGAGVLVTVPLD